jgi:hypothetical protein
MKNLLKALAFVCFASAAAQAQQPAMQFFRPYDQHGLNIFETTKADSTPFTGLHVRVGGAFAQNYQMLNHENYVTDRDGKFIIPASGKLTKIDSTNRLQKLTGGFNLAQANMFLDAQLDDGIRANVTIYLSAKHHNEAWVKNGYLQMDKLPFLNVEALNEAMKYLTIKVGCLEVDYGDAHWRRVDGGNEMYNPFVENYIMDEFATEIGGELYYHHPSGFFAMIGATSGMLNPTVVASNKIDSVTREPNEYNPAFHGKLGFDSQINPDLRIRLTGSFYNESSTSSSTLFGGDRTGSNYFFVLENTAATTTGNAFSGRINPGFSDEVSTFMINPFVKFMGFELFGTYEAAQGRSIAEKDKRKATQLAVDALYRFGNTEQFWIGGRYNSLTARLAGYTADIKANRIAASAGWFMTPNVMMKLEYVTQEYKDFAVTDIRNGGKFDGLVIQAAIGF